VLPRLHRSYGLMRQSSTLPVPMVSPLVNGSVPVAVSPGGEEDLPDVVLRLFPCVLGPLPRRLVGCTYPFLPTRRRPSPREDRVGAPPCPYSDFSTTPMARLQAFADVQARRFARPPVAPTDITHAMWQPWLLRPSLSRFVTSPCPGYAHRPHRAIDGRGTFTPSDTQPCRLLPLR
jgi:hypothetical protein